MNELYHHGIQGQKWGVQNGPPYPLDSDDKSAAEKRASGGKEYSEKQKARLEKRRKHVLKERQQYNAQVNRQLEKSKRGGARRGNQGMINASTATQLKVNDDFNKFMEYYKNAPLSEIEKDRSYERGKLFTTALKAGAVGAGLGAFAAIVPGAKVAAMVTAPQIAVMMANTKMSQVNDYYMDKVRNKNSSIVDYVVEVNKKDD